MKCIDMKKDYPKRLQSVNGGVVHAAYVLDVPTRIVTSAGKEIKRIPAHKKVELACNSVGKSIKYKEINSTTNITCKRCLRTIGEEELPALSTCRYVLQEKDSEYFCLKTPWRNRWVKDLNRAKLYQNEKAARALGKLFLYRHTTTGNKLTSVEYSSLPQKEKQHYKGIREFDEKKYVIRKVKLTLI